MPECGLLNNIGRVKWMWWISNNTNELIILNNLTQS